jgi:hypothetical protein
MHGTIPSQLIRLVHPVTGRFVAEYDPLRGLLLVVDRGKQAIIDLVRLDKAQRQEAQRVGQAASGGEAVQD